MIIKLYEFVDDIYDFTSIDISNIFSFKSDDDLKKIKEVAKQGKLYNQLASGKKQTF
jgi:hypothetical protein